MTVLYILDYGTIGGATKAFVSLVRNMKMLKVVPIVVTGKRNDLNELLEAEGIKTISASHYTAIENIYFKSWRWPYHLLKLAIRYYYHEFKAIKILTNQVDISKVDIIHTNSARNTLGCRISKKYGIPHVVHIREFGDKDFQCVRLNPQYIPLLNKYTKSFVSVSKAVLQHWEKKGIDWKKLSVIYDGVWHYDISVSQGEEKYCKVLNMIIAGGVFPTKGQHLAVEAFKYLPEEIRKNVFLDIVGWYSQVYVLSMKSYAREYGYENQIRFLGPKDNVHEMMKHYQIGLMCSRSEGFGLVTAEYMHGQLGVIASDSGACPELIENERTGLLFKSGDSHDLARCIERLYNDRELLVKLSINARKEALQRFTAEKNAESIYELYKELLNKE